MTSRITTHPFFRFDVAGTTSLERLTTLQQAIATSSFTYSDYATLLEKITNTNTLATDAHQYLTSAPTFYNDGGGGKGKVFLFFCFSHSEGFLKVVD